MEYCRAEAAHSSSGLPSDPHLRYHVLCLPAGPDQLVECEHRWNGSRVELDQGQWSRSICKRDVFWTHFDATDASQSIITLVFFITYTLCQPPATVLCRKIGPRVFLSTITFLWGIIMLSMGFVNDWTSLIGLRLVLGIFEVRFLNRRQYSRWHHRKADMP